MIVQCTVFEVQILKKAKLKNVVGNIRLIFFCSLKIQAKEHESKALLIKPVIQELHNPVSINVYANSCTLELPATPQNSLQLLFINTTSLKTQF